MIAATLCLFKCMEDEAIYVEGVFSARMSRSIDQWKLLVATPKCLHLSTVFVFEAMINRKSCGIGALCCQNKMADGLPKSFEIYETHYWGRAKKIDIAVVAVVLAACPSDLSFYNTHH